MIVEERGIVGINKEGYSMVNKINDFIMYLYMGNEYTYGGQIYKMDGDLNPYLVMRKYPSNEIVPIYQNSDFWNILIDTINDMTEEEYAKIKLEVATIKTLNKGK